MKEIQQTVMDSPIGRLRLSGTENGLTEIEFLGGRRRPAGLSGGGTPGPVLRKTVRQLVAYFSGKRKEFDLPLAPEGTPFQKATWKALESIPYGKTISYGELARRVGKPTASRAVGAANGRNPLPIVIPCHRVIGSNGQLTGYGGGLDIKERLLTLERAVPTRRTGRRREGELPF